MTTIALHKYSQKIEQLIEDHQLDEAITHCRHILQQHPRHVDTYRALAKAYLERGNYLDAVDLTQRILSTDPSDMIAHVGLSIAYKEQSNLDQSIWHLERALDVEPYNIPLREELLDLYTLKKVSLPDSMAPSSAALARMYLKSEMYNAAIVELRHSLAQEPDRIDLKVLLAETLYWANQRVEAVSLSLEILDVLPNCVPLNAIMADIWLQTGRVAEAQAYLQRLQAMTLLDKTHFDPETTVGRAFIARGAPPIPDEVTVEQFGEESLLKPDSETAVTAMVDSGWIEEFSMEDTAQLPEDEAAEVEVEAEEDEGVTGWLLEAARSTGEIFGTQPLVMPSDPLEEESDWFIDPGDEDDESLDELLGDVDGETQLDDWLTGLDSGLSVPSTDEPEGASKTGFTGMLTGLDSEPGIVDDTAVPTGFTDIFEDISDEQVEDASNLDLAELAELDLDQFLADENDESLSEENATGTVDDIFAEGLTTLFGDMGSPDLETSESFDETDDTDLDEFLASNLGSLAEAEVSNEEDEHTGYTELFDQLSTDSFPDEHEKQDGEHEELASDWLTPTTDALVPDSAEVVDDEEAPDWMAEVKQDEFEPVQIDPELMANWLSESDAQIESADETGQSNWLTALPGDEPEVDAVDDDNWLADLAGDGSSGDGSSGDELETAVSESKPLDPDDLSDIPIWMLGGEQDAPVVETQASTDFETGELEDDTAVPTWLLSGDKTSEGTGALDESAPMDDIIPPSPPQQREKPQTILAGEELPDWLRQPESDEQDESAVPDPLSTDSMVDLASGDLPSWLVDEEPDVEARPIPEPDSDHDLYKDDINIPDWLMADFSTGQDQAEVSVTGDKNEREPIPPQESEEGSKSSFEPSDEDNLGWLEELAASEDEAESASYASRVAAGEGGAVDEPPTQVSMPEELPDFGAEPDAVGWPEKFKEPESEMEDVLAGVTGELNADLDWLDSLAEESADVVKLADAIESAEGEIEEFDSGTGWLDDLIIAGDTGPLDELGSEPILPDFEDSLGVLPEEPEDDLGWLSELEESADSTSEPAELIVDSIEFEETAVSPEPEPDDAVAWLDELAVESDDSLEDLMDLADESAIEELHVELETESVDAALDWLEITPDEADELEISEEPEVGLTEVTDLEDPITNEPPEDIDDAMAWLEELAAGQGALLEELPSMAEPLATEPEIEIPQAPVDSSPEWLDTAVDEVAADDIAVETGLETNISAITDPESAVEDAAPEDIDDAMAWVEGLAAKQGARLEELPSMADAEMPVPDATDQLLPEASDASLEWLEELAEDAVENGDLSLDLDLVDGDLDPVDASLDWLDETLETVLEDEEAPGQEMEEALEAGLAADAPGTMDDAMVWLDALAEEQEAPSEEMPESTDETDVPDFIDPLSDMAELETTPSFDDTPADLDDAMGWLEDLAAEQDSPLEDLPTIAGVVDEAIFAEPESETPPPPEPEAPVDELTEALDWLEQLALKDSGPKVELPVRETAVSDSENDLAEALDWLDQLAKPEESPEEQTSGLVDLTDLTDEMPEDPDEALAWLQQVAAEQEEIDDTELAAKDEVAVDLVELPEAAKTTEPEVEIDVEPAVALEEPTESEIEDDILAEMPDDPDAAMAWLEQLAARQGAKLEELPTVSAEDMPIKVDEPDLEIEPEPSVDSDDVLLESEDEAASWLDDLMEQDEETAVEPTLEAAQDMDEPEDTDFPEADLTELEVPEDMDDAMAWLEALAVQQGAKLEELPTLSGTGEPSLESLDAADEDTAVVPEIEEITAEVEEAEAGMESSSDFSEIDEALIIPDEELTEDETFLSEGIEEDLPDWLDADTDALEAMPGQTQWLRELDEPDIDGWLNEEETTISSSYDRVVRSRFETPSDSAFETGSLSSLTDTPSGTDLFDLPDDEIETTVFDLDDEKLATARQAVENGVFDEAFQTYQILVDAGGGMMALIADLETIAVDHPDQPLFRHLLGDAYMRNGQLQKALDTYRVALDQI